MRYHEAASLASVVVSVLPCSAAYEAASSRRARPQPRGLVRVRVRGRVRGRVRARVRARVTVRVRVSLTRLEVLADDMPHKGDQHLLARLGCPAMAKLDLVAPRGEVHQQSALAHDLTGRLASTRQLAAVIDPRELA